MRRKRQSEAYKMKVVEEALQGGNFSHTARKHDLNPESVRVWVR
ncbi:helix-turn-helix domain-containing protein, partial [Paenibacillus sp. FJAT-27812]